MEPETLKRISHDDITKNNLANDSDTESVDLVNHEKLDKKLNEE